MTDHSASMLAQTAPQPCRGKDCDAHLHFRRNIFSGKTVPLDADPVAKDSLTHPGHHYAVLDGTRCRPANDDDLRNPFVPLYVSHYRTCKNVERFNRK